MFSPFNSIFWGIIFGTMLAMVLLVLWIVRYVRSKQKVKRGNENHDVFVVALCFLFSFATAGVFLYGRFFWIYRYRLDNNDLPLMNQFLVFAACAYALPALLAWRSRLAFIPFTIHCSLLLYVYLRDGELRYPHFLNLLYLSLAFIFLLIFLRKGFFKFNLPSTDKNLREMNPETAKNKNPQD